MDNTIPAGNIAGAIHLARLGYHVFPALPYVQDDGKINKPPARGVLWRRESTTTENVIQAWWARWPEAHPAIDCGASGVVAIDVDPRHGGQWEAGGYPTVSGGRHVLYREPRSPIGVDNTGRVAPGVDVRGMGGYVVCWAPADVTTGPGGLPALPGRVILAMSRVPETPEPEPVSHGETKARPPVSHGETEARPEASDPFAMPERSFTPEEAAQYVRREALDPLRAAREGTRNHALNVAAMVCGHFVPAFWSAERMTEGLAGAARAIGLDAGEIEPTIRSGLRAGQREPYSLRGAPETGAPGDAVDALIAELLDTDGLDSIPPPKPLIQDFLVLDSLASIVGKSGKGKSFVSIDMACHIGTGMPWHGHDTAKGGVVYLVAEGVRGIKRRVRAWEERQGCKATGVRFLPRPIQTTGPEWPILIEACRRIEPVFIVIDTQARVTVGLEENSAKDMGEFIHRAEALRSATGACVALVHHTGHQGDEGRGSTAVKGALQTQLNVSKVDNLVTVSTLKQKDEEEAPPLVLNLVALGESAVLVARGESVGDHLVQVPNPDDAFRGHVQDLVGVFLSVFSEGTGGTRAEVRQHFEALGSVRGAPANSRRKAFNRSWARLEELGRLARTEGTQRYKFITVDELDRQEIDVDHID